MQLIAKGIVVMLASANVHQRQLALLAAQTGGDKATIGAKATAVAIY